MLLVNKMETKLQSACFLPAVWGRQVTSLWPVGSFSLANASAASFVRWELVPELTAVVSCGDRGPFGLEISVCLWAQG